VPLHADTTEETPAELSNAPQDGVRGGQRELWRPALGRAATACLVGALVAVAVGVHLLASPTRTPAVSQSHSWAAIDHAEGMSTPARASRVVYARPVRLVVPKMGLDVAIQVVGLTAGHTIAAPSGPDTVGWFSLGPRPGNEGSAVIDGHSGYADGRAAAFDDLPELGRGDVLFIEDAKGRRAMFIVRRTKVYSFDADPAEVFAPTSGRRLNLITCTGSWDVAAGTHAQRLVVFAELRPSTRLLHRL
jgi:hypothetical protein